MGDNGSRYRFEELKEMAKAVRLVLLDVDGVLTDGSLWIGPDGEVFKRFNVKDGMGLKRLIASGIEVIFITGRKSDAVKRRAKELGISEVYQGVEDKGALARRLLEEKGLSMSQVCAVGDDLPDLAMFKEVAISVAVADAVKEVTEKADIVLENGGGRGAIRELCDWLLRSRQ